MTSREIEWDVDERALMLALFEFQAETCHGCGGWLPETTAKTAEGQYVADPPTRCHRCKAINAQREEYNDPIYHPDSYVIWATRDKREGKSGG